MKMADMEVKPRKVTPTSKQKVKETSGFLMSIVRTLSSSAEFEQRENEKARIEKAFRESDKRLTDLVTDNYQDLGNILQSFSDINLRVKESRDKITKIKHDLSSCKTLLRCKRDDLRRLWIEGLEHKTVVGLLDQIEQIKEVPSKFQSFMAKKYYLHATDTVITAVARLQGSLASIEALRDLRADLLAKKEQMHESLIEELNRQIYIKSVSNMTAVMKASSDSRKIEVGPHGDYDSKAARDLASSESVAKYMQPSLELGLEIKDYKEDLSTNPEDDLPHFISLILESLHAVRKMPEAVEAIKLRIQPELLGIVVRASKTVIENAGMQGENLSCLAQPRYLLDLLELVFQQFRCVANTHQLVLNNLQRIINSGAPMRADVQMYDMVDVWSKIQAVLQLLLSDYLDVPNSVSSRQQAPSSFDEPSTDIGAYFNKRKTTKPKKVTLFRFDASIHALSTNSYIEDHRQYENAFLGGASSLLNVGKPQLVCKPVASNITVIYNALQTFIKEIETSVNCATGSSSLQAFVTDFVKNIFLGQVHFSVSSSINAATKGFDALRNVIDYKTQKELNVPRPLLQSTVTVDKNIQDLREHMQDLPDYADQFLNMICNVLKDNRETCHNAYRRIVEYDSDERRIISAMWAKDDDINRFLRSLPSWRTLQPTEGQELNRNACSEDEMRALNSKEAVILISNLSSSDTLIPQHEIITDVTQMRTVANVHESLEWFAGRLRYFAASLIPKPDDEELLLPTPAFRDANEIPPVSHTALESLKSLAQDFQDLAEICLLLLHLEVRVHCFYYLLPVAKQSNYAGPIDDLDPDSNVLKLNKDLSALEEVLAQSLQPKKFRYIFQSLGYLVSSTLINCIQYLKKINENGIKKMCRNILAIQQNLTNITMTRESDMDHARQYYELLYTNPDDILNALSEKGTHFTLNEYIQLFQLQDRSYNQGTQLVGRIQRLQGIFEKDQSEVYDMS